MQKRIIVSILLSIFVILAGLGLISHLRVRDSIRRSAEDRLALANIIGTFVDHIIEENLTRLYDISLSDKIDFSDGDWGPEGAALRVAYEYSIFTGGVFLLDHQGSMVLTYPHPEGARTSLLGIPSVGRVLSEMKPVVSNVYTMERTRKKVIFVLVPLKSRSGEVVGVAGGEIDPTTYVFTRVIKSIPLGPQTDIELVDSLGIVIASSNPRSILTLADHNAFLSALIAEKKGTVGTCHRCHEGEQGAHGRTKDVLAFAPLGLAPWGVSVREPEKTVFLPSTKLKKGFFMLGLISLSTAFVLALGMSRSIVKPIRALTAAANRIAQGALSAPVDVTGTDEIAVLARSFEVMRHRLADSLQSIHLYSVGLEQRVRDRTKQLEEKQVANKTLLKKVITSEEDERKRIARELHDESLQALSALLMRIEMCKLHPEQVSAEKVEAMKSIVTGIINEMNKLVQNLRPSVLDDLGFEASIVWLLDRNLKEKKIMCFLNMDDFSDEGLTPELEITLFRIVQEASMNIARHSGATNAFVYIKTDEKNFSMSIEDDGEGFDTASALRNTLSGRGLGILGMKERAVLMNGRLTVCSTPGSGTVILCTIPLSPEARHA